MYVFTVSSNAFYIMTLQGQRCNNLQISCVTSCIHQQGRSICQFSPSFKASTQLPPVQTPQNVPTGLKGARSASRSPKSGQGPPKSAQELPRAARKPLICNFWIGWWCDSLKLNSAESAVKPMLCFLHVPMCKWYHNLSVCHRMANVLYMCQRICNLSEAGTTQVSFTLVHQPYR